MGERRLPMMSGRKPRKTGWPGRFDVENWPLRSFDPSASQAATALALVGAGFGATLLIGRLGDRSEDRTARPS